MRPTQEALRLACKRASGYFGTDVQLADIRFGSKRRQRCNERWFVWIYLKAYQPRYTWAGLARETRHDHATILSAVERSKGREELDLNTIRDMAWRDSEDRRRKEGADGDQLFIMMMNGLTWTLTNGDTGWRASA